MQFYSIEKVVFLLLSLSITVIYGQRVAPGVPPQHYQQVPGQQQQQYQQHHATQQQYQQQQQVHVAPGVAPQHYQPQQVQYQQVNVQQQQQQQPQQQFQQVPQAQPHQQIPQGQPHHQPQQPQQPHHGHHQPQQVLNTANIQQERAHIQEHIQVPIDTSKMSEAELQFHYFKMHDSDNNNKLDGCELIKSLIHWHEQGSKEAHTGHNKPHIEEKVFSDEELVALIDPILQMDDTSRDGYIDYPEFIKAQQKAATHQQQNQEQQQNQQQQVHHQQQQQQHQQAQQTN